MTTPSDAMPDALLFGNRFSTQEVPSREFPDDGMTAVDAMRLVSRRPRTRGRSGSQPRHFRHDVDGA